MNIQDEAIVVPSKKKSVQVYLNISTIWKNLFCCFSTSTYLHDSFGYDY